MWILLFVSVAGFFAQLIDGSMGMAFGVSATSFLLFLSYSPATASAVVHLAEVATTAVSGIAHAKFGNVDWPALLKIAIPGSIGAFTGAVLLSNLDFSAAKPWTAAILLALGVMIVARFYRGVPSGGFRRARKRWLVPLGLVGGFVDSTGGGGWGPVVTTSLTVSSVLEPRKAIGTTNTAEFAVAISASVGFILGLGAHSVPWSAVIALIVGGIFAAPLAAFIIKRVPQRILGLTVGFLIVFLNVRQIGISLDFEAWGMWLLLGLVVVIALALVARVVRKPASNPH